MAAVSFGGAPESYMDPPRMQSGGGGKGGGGLIASILDALGIGKQVAKEPVVKSDSAAPAAESGTTQSAQPTSVDMPVLNDAESAFQPITPLPSDWGQRYLDSMQPFKTIDPNTAF